VYLFGCKPSVAAAICMRNPSLYTPMDVLQNMKSSLRSPRLLAFLSVPICRDIVCGVFFYVPVSSCWQK